ncbi:succinate dehydrogenase/fumarate reductase transmembrane subunit [Verminephrobacter eiseniae]|uniref:succinate dehydrogenase n=1 Tax=Verminephrobacter eiseniae TaxID=364317 RepID=UPI0010D51EB4|nr:succinate dehydrogenase [Verminephrobacter eiseniae]KAB7604298.1 succinate dehydrogenase [Verminephrobacter sp. Larva24]MCW5232036.1 succinate dehydrogenase [Verminephrobacter eiseniae]MCW5296402.1 succinate dehydrogenase [Verminephrobacter eiseniae]MCW8184525.1 succinate dehydrogenase [Verminephrobacter eiseniae]MCW8223201.1 succinate dehydrogenase [Verminephrobacter eiseniae]
MRSPRNHRAYWAFLGHRLSGLALGLFLPAHLYVLGLALEESRRLEQFLKFAELGAVKFGEWGLVILLSLHMCFGLRLLALELLPWSSSRDARLSWITWGAVLSAVVGVVFAARVLR